MTANFPDFRQRLRQSQQLIESLPVPSSDAILISQSLVDKIRAEIRLSGGKIPFSRYMEMALYEPGLGYYSAGSHKLGSTGDFITAPEISSLFSRTLARAIIPALKKLPEQRILEVGAGSGIMAAEILAQLARDHALPEYYDILEVSADLRDRQQATLKARVPELMHKIHWLDRLPDNFTAVILANELLDAMPVHRFCIQDSQARELFVTEQNGKFDWHIEEPEHHKLHHRINEINRVNNASMPEFYISEILFAAEDWVTSMGQQLKSGFILLIDYGQPRSIYYHPQRSTGTLQCHYRHRVHHEPFVYPGLQDITTHVDFTAIADAAFAAGLNVDGFTTQAHFLLGSGLTDLVQVTEEPERQLAQANEIKKLTLPQEMGEIFKVMGLSKNLSVDMPGFQMNDMRNRL
ncbi:MAG: SAM-dependent methyltransferase [Gammaproteobacteria bacterium]|nr:SAM-dependent methyltransferase [Gammaproteobacteria bacterium]